MQLQISNEVSRKPCPCPSRYFRWRTIRVPETFRSSALETVSQNAFSPFSPSAASRGDEPMKGSLQRQRQVLAARNRLPRGEGLPLAARFKMGAESCTRPVCPRQRLYLRLPGFALPPPMPLPSPQVLIWTTCLLSSCATASPLAEDTGYILRETVRPQVCQLRRPCRCRPQGCGRFRIVDQL